MSVIRCPHCGEAIEIHAEGVSIAEVRDFEDVYAGKVPTYGNEGWCPDHEKPRMSATDRAAAREYWYERNREREIRLHRCRWPGGKPPIPRPYFSIDYYD